MENGGTKCGISIQWRAGKKKKKKKGNKVLIDDTTWMNLENIVMNKTGQTQQTTHCMIPFT